MLVLHLWQWDWGMSQEGLGNMKTILQHHQWGMMNVVDDTTSRKI
jgi:hypothetical protein